MSKKVYVEWYACCCGTVQKVWEDKEKAFQHYIKSKIQPFDEAKEREAFEKHIQESGDGDGGITEMEIEE